MKPKTFRLNEEAVTALERLSKERRLAQTRVIHEALSRFLEAHEEERRQQMLDAKVAMRTFELLEKDLGAHNLPDGERSWHKDREEIVVCIGNTEFHLLEANPREWLVLSYEEAEPASGKVKDGRIEWTPRRTDRGA